MIRNKSNVQSKFDAIGCGNIDGEFKQMIEDYEKSFREGIKDPWVVKSNTDDSDSEEPDNEE